MHSKENRELLFSPEDEIPLELGTLVFPFANEKSKKDFFGHRTRYNLQLTEKGLQLKLKIEIGLHTWERNRYDIIPYHREKSYIVTEDDFDLEKRRKKILQDIKKYDGFGIDPDFPLELTVALDSNSFVEDGLADYLMNIDSDSWRRKVKYKNNALVLLSALRVRAFAAGSSYESRLGNVPFMLPSEKEIARSRDYEDSYEYLFGDFYPLDTGPLAFETQDTDSMEDDGSDLQVGQGHGLCFANRKEEIEKIGIEFYLRTNLPE